MRRLFFFPLAVLSIFIIYFSLKNLITLTNFQKQISNLNKGEDISLHGVLNNPGVFNLDRIGLVHWDADVNYMLATAANNQAYQGTNMAQQAVLLSRAQDHYDKSLTLRPRDINTLTSNLNLLIDQGAPVDYVLEKLDRVISLVPKDQDLKAEISLVCFKLLKMHDNQATKKQIINQLRRLFDYSMDYRGITLVKRYSKLYGQIDILNQVLADSE